MVNEAKWYIRKVRSKIFFDNGRKDKKTFASFERIGEASIFNQSLQVREAWAVILWCLVYYSHPGLSYYYISINHFNFWDEEGSTFCTEL